MKDKVIYFLYRLLQAAGIPLILLYFVRRGLKDRRYWRSFRERLGWVPGPYRQTAQGAVWLHAVSVGEVISATELLRRLRAELPSAPLFVSVTTVAGRALAKEKLKGLADGVFYAPLDYCFAVRRVLRTLQPQILVVFETEIWPNLFREAQRAGCGLLVVNGRISDKAWPRYRAFRWFFRPILELPHAILAQDEVSAKRYLELGGPPEKVRVVGNLKYDFDPQRAKVAEVVRDFLKRTAPGKIWIAASTMPPAQVGDVDEDEAVLQAFEPLSKIHPELLLMLVPRKPERFNVAAGLLDRAGVRYARRSKLRAGDRLKLPGVLLVDSIGELSGLFQSADAVFMGGTLAQRGGHNILEPAAFGKPVIVGPHMENFPVIIKEFRAVNAVFEIENASELRKAVDGFLRDPGRRAEYGERARGVAAGQQGATARVVEEIRALYQASLPRFRPPAPVVPVLYILSRLWLAGGAVKRRAGLIRQARLRTLVVSIGGLSMGGAGKTPFVLWLAERLKARGIGPAILMRGYQRQKSEAVTLVEAGGREPASRTGDEAQIYLRAGIAPVGIGADRAAAGRLMEQQFQPDVFLLDDGFQHARLARQLDIVLIDALDPFAGGVFPLGRLRETPEALARADALVLTRSECESNVEIIEARLRQYNSTAPIFRCRVRPRSLVNARTGEEHAISSPPFVRPGAFCGLANPASFWGTLRRAGCTPVFTRRFPDHHPYTDQDLSELDALFQAHRCGALLTTEKDSANLPPGWQRIPGLPPLYWVRIGLEVDGGEELIELVTAAMAAIKK